ncbi:MAG: asparagine synthase (glutamine-hydrolyzing) [Spirochaetales bacterium]|nr:asparagine synthase (glutamine-hydrolyzing) [Spirochaetales bacterium]
MCGICGIVSKRGELPPVELIVKMMERLIHRGPDGAGWFRDRKAALGHTRLSIIDLEGGVQPLCNEDESLWISFNGEIYNYIELRRELISLGHVFRTQSDTEVIVHAWESWGENCFSRFNGQWALALWDRKEDRLILSRDRHGIRPLYYTEGADRFLFASEVKSLFVDQGVERSFSLAGLQEIYTFWGPVAPDTAFSGVYEIPPGCYGVYEDSKLTVKEYWKISFPHGASRQPLSEKAVREQVEYLREKMDRAVRLRFERSDVPVGAYLSGGIDSSVSSAIVKKYAKKGIKTFSLRFSDSQYDEGSYQQEMVDFLGADHSSFLVNPRDMGEVFPQVIDFTERPILRTAPAPLFLLSKLVRESGYKVVVTGEGADEVLWGYDIFREAYIRNKIAREGFSEGAGELLGKLYPWMGGRFNKTPAFTQKFFAKNLDRGDAALSHRPRWDNFRLLLPLLSEEAGQYTKAHDVVQPLLGHMPRESRDWSYLEKAQWLEYNTLLSGYILSAQGDSMLMGHSVEGRFPFLDVELDEFANALDPEMKLNSGDFTEKYILKEAYKEELPRDILHRPKQPYRAPDGLAFLSEKGQVLPWIGDILTEENVKRAGLFRFDGVNRLLAKVEKNGGTSLSYGDNFRILSVLSTMQIYSRFILQNDFSQSEYKPWERVASFDYSRTASLSA